MSHRRARTTPHRTLLHVLAWAACVAVGAKAAGGGGGGGGEEPPAAGIERVLRELPAQPPSGDMLLAHRIAKLGRGVVPALFDRLSRSAAGRLAAESTALDESGRREKAVLLGALAALPEPDVRGEIALRLACAPSAADRAAALYCCAAIGASGELDSMLAIAEPELDPDGLEVAFDARVADAVGELALRDTATWRRGLAVLPGLRAGPRLSLLRAAGANAGEEALSMLARALGVLASNRADVLAAMQTASQRASVPVHDEVRRAVRELLDSADDQVAAPAALLSGRFEDADAAEALVELLEHVSTSVRGNALWSLQRISGLGMRADPRRWRAWIADERRWWNSEFEPARRALRSAEPRAVRTAILELGRRRLGRDRLASELATVLDHEDVDTAEIAAAAMGALRSRASIVELEAARGRVAPRVQDAIDRALGAIRAPASPPRTSGRRT
ncbi:MAG: hypothetical protein HZA53_08470 [Planctomycetes bacterium]|nr:hypothetical protein [Planctomycetota bacterium]